MKALAGIFLLISTLVSLLMAAMVASAALLLAGLTETAKNNGIESLFVEWGVDVPPEIGDHMQLLNEQVQTHGGDAQLYMLIFAGVVALTVPLQLVGAINVFREKGKTMILVGSVCALLLAILNNFAGMLLFAAPGAIGGILGLLVASKMGQDQASDTRSAQGDNPPEEKKSLDLGSLFKRKPKDPDAEVHEAETEAEGSEDKKSPLSGLFSKSDKKPKPKAPRQRSSAPPMDSTEKALAGLFVLGLLSLVAFAFFRLLEIGAI